MLTLIIRATYRRWLWPLGNELRNSTAKSRTVVNAAIFRAAGKRGIFPVTLVLIYLYAPFQKLIFFISPYCIAI